MALEHSTCPNQVKLPLEFESQLNLTQNLASYNYNYYLVISADISILLWFCTCYKSLPSVLIFSSIGTPGSSYRTPGSSYRTLGSGMFFFCKKEEQE